MGSTPVDSMFHSVPVERLAPMFDPTAGASDWSPEELIAIYRHQVSTPLDVELTLLPPQQRQVLFQFLKGKRTASILWLLRHPAPPLEVLVLLKDYAKASRDHPASPIPLELATTLYWLAVAAAAVRCGATISTLAPADIKTGFEWTASRPWIEAPEATLAGTAKALF